MRPAAGHMKGAPPAAAWPEARSLLPRPGAAPAFPGIAGGGDPWPKRAARGARGPARSGAGGGDVAATQAGGARPRREAEQPREEALSGPGAATGGSGNAGSGACPGERRAGSASRSAAGLRRRPVSPGGAFSPRGAGGRGPGVPPLAGQPGPQPHARSPVSTPIWVSVPPPASPPRAQGGEVSGALPVGPLGGRARRGTWPPCLVRLPGKGRPGPEARSWRPGRGVGQALRGSFTLVRST